MQQGHVDQIIWGMLEKDVLKQGFGVTGDSIRLKFEELIRSRARGGFTIGQLVHQSTLNDWGALTFDDISGSPYRALASRRDADLSTTLTKDISLNMPLVSANMESVTGYDMAVCMARMGGIGVLHQFISPENQADSLNKVKETAAEPVEIDGRVFKPALDKNGRYLVGAAIGVKEGNLARAKLLAEAGADILVVDIAHGHSDHMINTVRELKKLYPKIPVVGGNVVTPKGAYELCNAGVDVIKVGVGPGAACTTRLVTGYGIPQITAIYQTAIIAKEFNVKIMADGGIRNSGDMIKALAAGADTIMAGSILAATDKSNNFKERILEHYDGGKPKSILYFGSASALSKQKQGRGSYEAPEGRSACLPYRGPTLHVLSKLITGMESGISYAGSSRNLKKPHDANIQRLRTKSRWIKQTNSGIQEGNKGNSDADYGLNVVQNGKSSQSNLELYGSNNSNQDSNI